MIIVTGAAGFIGSCMVKKLNDAGYFDITVVDDFSRADKNKNLNGKLLNNSVDREKFFTWLEKNGNRVDFIFHLGARTDTAEFDKTVFDKLNLEYSQRVWQAAVRYEIPLIYASSAATYGMGELGYTDNQNLIPELKPLNPYGESKNEFDKWVLTRDTRPPYWAGFKFFNVYGPNEYHKGRMASVIFGAFKQIKETGNVKLFRSHNPDFEDGQQLRDFIYVKDITDVLLWVMENRIHNGIYNLGTGKARSFIDLTKATFASLNVEPNIEFIDTPVDIRNKYQYYTQADMTKLITAGYKKPFTTLEEGVKDYVVNYLKGGLYH